METTNNVELKDLEQKINSQQMTNEKLLRKYVIARTGSFCDSVTPLIFFTILITSLAIWAHFQFDLKWPIIIAVCLVFFFKLLFEIVSTIPLSKGNLIVTKVSELQPKLLKYKKSNLLFYSIFIPVFIGILVWLAFELRDIFANHFLGIEYDKNPGQFAFVITIGAALAGLIGLVSELFSKSKAVDKLVAEIDELKL